ncbi:hypothetical protein Barb7_00592 [Bacteroidales bacterium Barb7]|nr:hypothetical protein Barb7_00592 [Bacteroidales bacterium Barb7]
MCGDDAAGVAGSQLPHQSERAFLFVNGVGAFEDFVENDKEFFALPEPVDNHFEPFQFGEEIGFVAGQGVGSAQTGYQSGGTDGQRGGKDRSTDTRQQIVHACRAQIGTFSRHIGTGDNQKARAFPYLHVISHAYAAMKQRMTQVLSFHPEVGSGNIGEDIVGMIESKAAQRSQGIELTQRIQPTGGIFLVRLPPTLQQQSLPRILQTEYIQQNARQTETLV